ncbi:MAG: CoA ester lyase [Hyphomicrobiales bacterium]|nr:MAG: CoA ester lyase [Hyphomicrobiales bacterium]
MRSLLFIPADDEKKLSKGTQTGADVLLLDLEDAVAPSRKGDARKICADYLARTREVQGRPRLFVRINALDTPYWADDLAGIVKAQPDGIMLPKPRGGGDVHTLSVALDHAEQGAGIASGSIRIIAIATETAISLLNMPSYVGASARLEGLTWGAEDLSAAVGARTNREADGRTWTSPFMLARNLCLMTGVAAGAQPIDTVFVNFRDAEGLRAEASTAARDGFTGKMAIHPNQVAIINEVFTPTEAETAEAEEIIAAFRAQPDAGVVGIRGKMIDKAHLALAERLMSRAAAARRQG